MITLSFFYIREKEKKVGGLMYTITPIEPISTTQNGLRDNYIYHHIDSHSISAAKDMGDPDAFKTILKEYMEQLERNKR